MKERDPGIAVAVAAAGSQKALAEFLGLRKSNVTMWAQVPAKHVPAISAKYRIPQHELRPDLWRPGTEPLQDMIRTLLADNEDLRQRLDTIIALLMDRRRGRKATAEHDKN